MKKQWFLLAGILSLASACSTYTTNSKTSFDSVLLSGQEPEIHVGDIKETPDKLALLGWVEASVTQPHMFSDAPSEAQANIILAEKGAELGADAVIYVTYKTLRGLGLRKKIEARGQAVQLKDDSASLVGIQAPRAIIHTKESGANGSARPNASLQPQASSGTAKKSRQQQEKIPVTVEDVMKIRPTSAVKPAETVSLYKVVEEKARTQAKEPAPASECSEPSLNDIAEYESNIDAINYMLMNADFLVKKSRGLKDKEMESATERLILLLEQQLAKTKAKKPAARQQ